MVTDQAVSLHRPSDVKQLLVALICFALVVAGVFAVQAARRAAWTEDCRQKGGMVTRDGVETAPVLAPGFRAVYICAGPDGQTRQWG